MARSIKQITDEHVSTVFARVKRFVARKFPALSRTVLNLTCRDIAAERKRSARSFMHTGHLDGPVICTWGVAAGVLDRATLAALFLHEFGHVAGHDEAGADKWVFEHFGIPIQYVGPLRLEWADPGLLEEKGL